MYIYTMYIIIIIIHLYHGEEVSQGCHQVVLLAGLQHAPQAAGEGARLVSQHHISAHQQVACPVGRVAVATVVYNLEQGGM